MQKIQKSDEKGSVASLLTSKKGGGRLVPSFRLFIMMLVPLVAGGEQAWQASWIGEDFISPEVRVTRATFMAIEDPALQTDVTERVQEKVDASQYVIEAKQRFIGKDPAPGKKKKLELEYTVDGAVKRHSVNEGVTFDLLLGDAIGKGVSPVENRWYAFRKTFSLKDTPQEALTKISVDSKYWLWVNGERVVFEGQLKRGPTPNDTYYDVIDLAPYLKSGENTVALLLWYFGKEGFSHKDSGKAGLLFQADLGEKTLISDASWKVIRHPAFGNTEMPHPNFRLPESNIYYDAQKELAGWQEADFNDAGWGNATDFGKAPCAPWNQLVKRPIPFWKDFGLKDYENAGELPKVSDGQVIHAKLPYNAQVTPYFIVEGAVGKKILVRTDQSAVGPNVRGVYVTKEGKQEYENLGWMNGHEVQYTIPKGMKIHALKYRETGYATEFSGHFSCDDRFLNTYHKKAVRTLYVTMRDTYLDCPDRERAQWWGDLVNEMGEAFYALDRASDHLTRKGILELTSWARPDGSLYSPVPDGNWNRELPMQMLNAVGYYGFWTYYLYSGDLQTIRVAYPAVRKYMNLWELGDDGLVRHRNGQWLWGDWGDDLDLKVQFNGWYYLALLGQYKQAEALGEESDLPLIKDRMKSIRENFNKVLWNGKEYRSPEYKGNTDERGHALAVLAGLAKPEQYGDIQRVFETSFESSPYLEKYVGEAQFKMGCDTEALGRIRKRYKEMVESDCSTLSELWNGKGTNNHAWSGGALTLLSQYVAGIEPLAPAFTKYQVAPQMGDLKELEILVPSIQGAISLKLIEQEEGLEMDLSSPEGTEAVIHLPKRHKVVKSIYANGERLWEGGRPFPQKGVTYLKETEGAILFSLEPGQWKIEMMREK